MSKLDEIKKKIEADRQQDEQRQQELKALRNQINDLDEQIDAAISNDHAETAEKLLNKQNELKNKLAIMERIGARKTAPDAYYDDLKAICAETMSEIQQKVDKIEADMEKARKAYLEKKIALAKLLYDAAVFRSECGTLAGLGALWSNPRFESFSCVRYVQDDLDCTDSEAKIIAELYPEFGGNLNEIYSYSGLKS